MKQENAMRMIIDALQPKDRPKPGYATYGYDLFVPALLRDHFEEKEACKLSPVFFNAAWELCRRGILRPGVRRMDSQSIEQGSAGAGFSVTLFGQKWLSEAQHDLFVPTEPERLGELLAEYKDFGPGYHERAQEAIRCYDAHAYLAACVMCGAATESILLAAAIEKSGNEESVLKRYQARSGRKSLENLLFGKARSEIELVVSNMNGLLKYWRDEAAHGMATGISEAEAFTALGLLLRVAMHVRKYWEEITAR